MIVRLLIDALDERRPSAEQAAKIALLARHMRPAPRHIIIDRHNGGDQVAALLREPGLNAVLPYPCDVHSVYLREPRREHVFADALAGVETFVETDYRMEEPVERPEPDSGVETPGGSGTGASTGS